MQKRGKSKSRTLSAVILFFFRGNKTHLAPETNSSSL